MRFADIARVGFITAAATIALAGMIAMRRPPTVIAPPQVEPHSESMELTVHVRDAIGDRCVGDVQTKGTHVYVHLAEDPKTCAGVTRIYRVEGEALIFEQELIDI